MGINHEDENVLAAVGKASSTDLKLLNLLNRNAPNSWTIYNRRTNEVWKVIKPRALKYKDKLHVFLEKEAIDHLPKDCAVVKYTKEGNLDVVGIDKGGKVTKLPYLVFPFVSGTPLDKELIKRRGTNTPFTDEEVKKVGKQIVEAVAVMFKNSVIHQDIKPGNIILTNKMDVSILDLGIARFVYDDLSMVKSMQGPYAYLSPERLDMIANLSDANKRCLSFPSDLFSVGMILFEMATLKRVVDLVQPGEIRSFYNKLEEYGLSDELQRILYSFLVESPLNRQNLVAEEFGVSWFDPKQEIPITLWIQHQSNGWGFIKDFVEDCEDKNCGVILAADQKGSATTFENRAKEIHELGGLVAMDPVTYRLAYDDIHHSYLKAEDRKYGQIVSAGMFTDKMSEGKGRDFVSKVFEFETLCNPDILIAPHFTVGTEEKYKRWFDANFGAWKMSVEYYQKAGLKVPLYFGVVLSESLVCSEKDLEKILLQVLYDTSIKNVYLHLENLRDGSMPNKNITFLHNVRKLINAWSYSKNVLYSFADLEVFGYLGDGLSSFAINPDYEKRKQSIFEKLSKPEKLKVKIDWEKRRKRYFAHQLWNDVLAETELRNSEAKSLGSDSIFHCDCPYCFEGKADKRLDPDVNRKHFLFHIHKFTNEMSSQENGKRREKFLEKLEAAKSAYNYLQTNCRMKFDSQTDGSFIGVWEEVFKDSLG